MHERRAVEARDAVLAFRHFPTQHWRKIWSTNPLERLNKEINTYLQAPDTRKQLSSEGAEPRTATPEEFGATMAKDLQKWAKVVTAAEIKIK